LQNLFFQYLLLKTFQRQLADVNQGWEPKWKKDGCKWCIHGELVDGHFIFVVAGFWHLRHFLTFKTKEDAEKFLATNIEKITMNTPLTTIFFPFRLPSLINISKLL
jgi:hypothetical protein